MFLNTLKMGGAVVLLAGLTTASVGAGQAKPDQAVTYVDLQPKANQKLKEAMIPANFADNDLAELKQGKETLEGFKFNIGEGMIRLANNKLKDKLPDKVEGIKIGAKFAQLHILHATAYREAPDAVIAKYIVHYADKTDATIDVVYGQDVLDWWNYPGTTEPTRSKVVWKGANAAAKQFEATLWLFATTWKNPHPMKQVVSIDFVSMLTDAAPFVVAMTLAPPTKDVGVGKDGVRFIKVGKFAPSLAFCDDGNKLAAVLWTGFPQSDGDASSVVVWDVSKGQLAQTLETFNKELRFWRVAASKDGRIVAASASHRDKDDYGAIRVWDAAANKVLHTLEFSAPVQGALALSPDGKKVAGGACNTASAQVRVWDVPSGTLLRKLQAAGMEYFAVALSDDGKWIAGGGRVQGNRGKVVVWDLETGKVKYEWSDNFMLTVTALEFSRGGKLVAAGGPHTGETRVWDMATGKLKHMLNEQEATQLAFSPDGNTLAAGADNKVVLWDMTQGKARATFEVPSSAGDRTGVSAIAFAPDGRTLAVGSAGAADGTIRFWPVPR
jgi:WD40 repeat protein